MRSRLPLLLSVTALLLLAVLVARGRTAVSFDPPQLHLTPPTQTQPPGPPPGGLTTPDGVGAAVDVIVLVVVIVVALFGLAGLLMLRVLITRRRLWARMPDPVVTEDLPVDVAAHTDVDALLRGTRATAAELRARVGGPPADLVIAAWLGLERSATDSGTQRLPHQTPSEFVATVLAAHHVDATAIASLRELYARARFKPSGSVTVEDAEAAGQALDRIVADLAVSR